MEAKNSADGRADGSLGIESTGDVSGSFSIFESLEELRQAQTHDPASASRSEGADEEVRQAQTHDSASASRSDGADGDASLESELSHYKEWLSTLSR